MVTINNGYHLWNNTNWWVWYQHQWNIYLKWSCWLQESKIVFFNVFYNDVSAIGWMRIRTVGVVVILHAYDWSSSLKKILWLKYLQYYVIKLTTCCFTRMIDDLNKLILNLMKFDLRDMKTENENTIHQHQSVTRPWNPF